MKFCTEEYTKLYNKVLEGLERDYRKEIQAINRESAELNHKIASTGNEKEKLELYKNNQERYEQTNKNVLDIENDFFTFKSFSTEF
jgi:predicted  nucleic acid-binding Zn-ribbon protein